MEQVGVLCLLLYISTQFDDISLTSYHAAYLLVEVHEFKWNNARSQWDSLVLLLPYWALHGTVTTILGFAF